LIKQDDVKYQMMEETQVMGHTINFCKKN